MKLVNWVDFSNQAAANASDALKRWTGGTFELKHKGFERLSFESLFHKVHWKDSETISIFMGIDEGESGAFLLVFSRPDVEALGRAVMKVQGVESDSDMILKSAVLETANVLGSDFLNRLGVCLGRSIRPTPPAWIEDFAESTLQSILSMVAASQSDTLWSEIFFEPGHHGKMLFLPIFSKLETA